MEKKTKILLCISALVIVACIISNSSNKTKNTSFVNANGEMGNTCKFKFEGIVIEGKFSELDKKECFSKNGKRGLAI